MCTRLKVREIYENFVSNCPPPPSPWIGLTFLGEMSIQKYSTNIGVGKIFTSKYNKTRWSIAQAVQMQSSYTVPTVALAKNFLRQFPIHREIFPPTNRKTWPFIRRIFLYLQDKRKGKVSLLDIEQGTFSPLFIYQKITVVAKLSLMGATTMNKL